MSHADLLANLLPPVTYDPNAARLAAELGTEGAALDRTQGQADAVSAGIFPYQAGNLLADWERVCGLTPSGTYQERIAAVLAKLVELGGLSIPYFVRIASRLGYTITIAEPQQFYAGFARAGDALAPYEAIWVWHVLIHGNAARAVRFRAGESTAGERLTIFGDPVLETLFNNLKPAHTLAVFRYLEN